MKINKIKCKYTTKEKFILLLAYMYLILSPIIKIWLLHYYFPYEKTYIVDCIVIILTIFNFNIIKYYYTDLTECLEPRRDSILELLDINPLYNGKIICVCMNIGFMITTIIFLVLMCLQII